MKIKIDTKLKNKIISWTATAVLVVTVCLCLIVIIQVLGRGYVSIGGHSFFRVVTGSMEPNISVGELIMTDDVPIESVQHKDIVSFRSQSADMFGTIITHRVVEIEKTDDGQTVLLTKGDANLSVDGRYVTKENYIGKVVWSSGDSAISAFFSFVSGKYGFFACIVLPSLIILMLVLSSVAKALKRDMNKIIEASQNQKMTENTKAQDGALQEDYDKMCERIRKELMEELRDREETEQPKIE